MTSFTDQTFDFVIIGSGFGGSVKVVDGSIMPANRSLTITALAEYAMRRIPARSTVQ
jgi:hypothetical protein